MLNYIRFKNGQVCRCALLSNEAVSSPVKRGSSCTATNTGTDGEVLGRSDAASIVLLIPERLSNIGTENLSGPSRAWRESSGRSDIQSEIL